MNSVYAQKAGRIYAFDWLRIMACAVVVLIHCLHMFGELYSAREALRLNDDGMYAISFVTYWCMDVFFLLAGASTWLALRKKTARQFLTERFQRLLLPLVIGFILLVPCQAYFELVSNGRYSGTLMEFYPYFLGNILFKGQFSWIIANIHHLWFLAYLFVFSLVALPLCVYLRGTRGMAWVERLAALCERPGGFLLPVLPIVGVELGLRALFPVYCGLADALCWLLFYLSGYILFASPRLRQALHRQGRSALELALAALLVIFTIGSTGILHSWMSAPNYSLACLLFQVLAALALWSCVLATLAAGEKYLNRNTTFLAYGSAASFSWYLLHFPIVIIVAYCLLPRHLPAPAAYGLIVSYSLTLTVLLTHLFLKANGALAQLSVYWFTAITAWLKPQSGHFVNSTAPLERVATGRLG